MIEKIHRADLPRCLSVLHSGYAPIAERFGLTDSNCPYRGRAALPLEVLEKEMDEGAVLYGYCIESRIVGVVSLSDREEEIKLNDLVVLPQYQRQGIGTALLAFAKETARERGYAKVVLGMIDGNRELKEWYIRHGFENAGYKKYPTAPFTVGYMAWNCTTASSATIHNPASAE